MFTLEFQLVLAPHFIMTGFIIMDIIATPFTGLITILMIIRITTTEGLIMNRI